MYWLEDKRSGVGWTHEGDIDTACRHAKTLCGPADKVVVWSSDNDRLAEVSHRGTCWVSKRGQWEFDQLAEAARQREGMLAGLLGED